MSEPQSFTTEHGHVIPFVPDHFKRNNFYVKWASSKMYGYTAGKAVQPVSYYQMVKDWVQFSATVNFLQRYGKLARWRKAIDLGGGEGTIMRLFKAADLVDEGINLDIEDYSQVVSDDIFAEFIKFCLGLTTEQGAVADEARQDIGWMKWILDYMPHHDLFGGMWMELTKPPVLDHDLCMDALKVDGKYDLVASFSVLERLDAERTLPKIRDLLAPGGIFVGTINWSWFPVHAHGIVGHFPYAMQRLSQADVQRYYLEHHPQYTAHLDARYNEFSMGGLRPTLTELLAKAREHGLRPLAIERIQSKRQKRFIDTPLKLMGQPWFSFDDVLRDARYIKPGITVDELLTSTVRVAFGQAG